MAIIDGTAGPDALIGTPRLDLWFLDVRDGRHIRGRRLPIPPGLAGGTQWG